MKIGIDIDGVLTDIEQWQLDYGSKFYYENYCLEIKNYKGYETNEIPVICYHANYNEQCNGKNIYRCYSWYDIYRKIKEIF